MSMIEGRNGNWLPPHRPIAFDDYFAKGRSELLD
jgi:hypothetical protein